MNLALYQGVPKVDSQVEVGRKKKKPMLMSDGGGDGGGSTGPKHDPTIICTAFKRHRFYLFSQREPEDSGMSTHTHTHTLALLHVEALLTPPS